MEILFDKHHPKNLIEAIRLVQSLDVAESHIISFYDSSIKDEELKNPILLRVDRHKRGIEPVTEILYENGFRVFALKFPPDQDLDCFDLSLAVLRLWPQILRLLKEKKNPFIYKCNSQLGKLVKVKD